MKTQDGLLISGIAALAVLSTPAIAQAVTFTDLPTFTDAQFEALRSSGVINQVAVAEGRFGDRGGNATFEQAILNGATNSPVAQANFAWLNGQAYNFTLSRSGSTLTYIVSGQTLTFDIGSALVDAIYFRTRAEVGDDLFLNTLAFDGSTIPFNGFSVNSDQNGEAGVDWWLLSDISGDFALTGQLTLGWAQDGDLPLNSRLATQLKLVSRSAVPTPALLPGLVSLGVAAIRKKAQQANV